MMPGVRVVKSWPEHGPQADHDARRQEDLGRSDEVGASPGKLSKLFVHANDVEHGLCHVRYVIPLAVSSRCVTSAGVLRRVSRFAGDGGRVFHYLWIGKSPCSLWRLGGSENEKARFDGSGGGPWPGAGACVRADQHDAGTDES